MRQLLKRARTLVQEGEYERPRVLLGAALALRPDTKRLVADATQMREELARNRKEETMNIGPEPQQPGGGVPQVYALMSSTRRILARSNRYCVSHEYETVSLEPSGGLPQLANPDLPLNYSPKLFQGCTIGDFYGGPQAAIIDWNEKWRRRSWSDFVLASRAVSALSV